MFPIDDFAEARDGEHDHVDCGPDAGAVSLEPDGHAASSCATVYPG